MTDARVSAGMLYIDGKWAPAESGVTEPVHEKATGEVIGEYAVAAVADVDRAHRGRRPAGLGGRAPG